VRVRAFLVSLSLVSFLGCASDDAPANQVTGVRILATQADKPYAEPGEEVKLRLLAVDGRANKPRPMRLMFLNDVCVNPKNDDVSDCFASLTKTVPVGAVLGNVPNAAVTMGDEYTFRVPVDALPTASQGRGQRPIGLAVVFAIACAGEVRRVAQSAEFDGSPPFGCFDETGQLLSKNDYVVAHARVNVVPGIKNQNPVIDQVLVDGRPLDPSGNMRLKKCLEQDDARCGKAKVTTLVAESAQEPDPFSGFGGQPSREQIWVNYYLTAGKMENDFSVLYSSDTGRVEKAETGLFARTGSGPARLIAVVRDNRGGVSWREYPFVIE
jgi:hypothetical protein